MMMTAYVGSGDRHLQTFDCNNTRSKEFSTSRSTRLNPGESASCMHWIGGWVHEIHGVDVVAKKNLRPLPGIENW
jgi:hypothetical protein